MEILTEPLTFRDAFDKLKDEKGYDDSVMQDLFRLLGGSLKDSNSNIQILTSQNKKLLKF